MAPRATAAMLELVTHRESYDAVIVGARAAGAATATLLARSGLRVLLLDKARRGSDTLSTLALMRAGVVLLDRWGLLDRLVDAGTPPVRRTVFHYGRDRLDVDIKPGDGIDALYAPRRTRLDPMLADAAEEAGVEVRFETDVREVLRDRSGRVTGVAGRDQAGRSFHATATVTIGADGRRSSIARAVDAPVTHRAQAAGGCLVTYVDGVQAGGYEWMFGPDRMAGFVPTDDGLTNVWAAVPQERFRALASDRPYDALRHVIAEISQELADRLTGTERVTPVRGFPGAPGVVRRPYGPGWALVGDAGFYRDPCTAHGLTDAFRDADLLAGALVDTFGGADWTAALTGYERARNAVALPLLDVTDEIASLRWDMVALPDLHRRLSRILKSETMAVVARHDRSAVDAA